MNYLQILFEADDYSKIFAFLKRKFATCLSSVEVDTLVEDQLVRLTWDGLLDPNDVAVEMTEAIPSIIIEAPSSSGIESSSRYFNKTQLW